MATKRLKDWFFQITSVVRADGTTGGIRFRKSDKSTQGTFEDLLASTTFSKESSDRAKPYTGSADLGTEQGLSVLATDAQAKANQAQLGDRSLVVSPSQLPTVVNINNTVYEDFSAQVAEVTTDGGIATRNNFQVRLLPAWLTTLYSRVFKQGGSAAHVPIKNSGTNYDWSWGDLSQNATFVANLLANNTFTTGLGNNSNFVSTLIANTTFTSGLANNSNFYTTLASNTSFITDLTSNATFISEIQGSVVTVDKSITKNAGNNDAIELVNDSAAPGNLKLYGTSYAGTRGYFDLVEYGTKTVVGADFRFTNWSTFVFTIGTINNGKINYWRVGKVLTLNFTLNVEFSVAGTIGAEVGDVFIKIPLLASVGSPNHLDENFTVPIGDDTPSTTSDFAITDDLMDTQSSLGCGLDEVHFSSLVNIVGTPEVNTLILRGQIQLILNI